MGPKLGNELFYKLVKLFFRVVQVPSLSPILRGDLTFELNALKMIIPISSYRFEYAIKTLIRYGV